MHQSKYWLVGGSSVVAILGLAAVVFAPTAETAPRLDCPSDMRSRVVGEVAPGAEGYASPSEAAAHAPAKLLDLRGLDVEATNDPLAFLASPPERDFEAIIHVEALTENRWIATSAEACAYTPDHFPVEGTTEENL